MTYIIMLKCCQYTNKPHCIQYNRNQNNIQCWLQSVNIVYSLSVVSNNSNTRLRGGKDIYTYINKIYCVHNPNGQMAKLSVQSTRGKAGKRQIVESEPETGNRKADVQAECTTEGKWLVLYTCRRTDYGFGNRRAGVCGSQ